MTSSLPPSAVTELLPGLANDIITPAQYAGDNLSFLRRAFEKLLPLVDAHTSLEEAVRAGRDHVPLLAAVDAARAATKLDHLRRQVPRALEHALHGLAHINGSMRALKELARPAHGTPEATDLHELLEAVTTLTRGEWQYVADLKLDFDWSLPAVSVLRAELTQLLEHALLMAARNVQATLPGDSTEKGTLVVVTRRMEDHAELEMHGGGAELRLRLPFAAQAS